MILSMTGFGAASRELAHGAVAVEIKGVNSRFLDPVFRLGDDFRSLEPALREMVAAQVTRGKIEIRLGLAREPGASAPAPLSVNADAVVRLAAAAREVVALVPDAAPLSVRDILGWPGVLADASPPADAMRAEALSIAAVALAEFQESRRREGAKLKAMIEERVAGVSGWVAKIEPKLPGMVAEHHARLAARLRDALGAADDERVRQEVALFGMRIDVAEEVSRLTTHLAEVRRVLDAGGACGKRLDFLMQELHREANTLGSKSVASEVSAAALEMKLLIEQMREQVQNIE
ncbi:MAG: YicC family protein [Burkholderiales bacterium]|nr:YicC family protein [Burkholderiales bacterium]